MRCPNDSCDFETDDNQEMLQHIPTHDKLITKTEYGYSAEIYTNSKGTAQIIVSAKGDSIDDVVTKTFIFYNMMKDKASSEGVELV